MSIKRDVVSHRRHSRNYRSRHSKVVRKYVGSGKSKNRRRLGRFVERGLNYSTYYGKRRNGHSKNGQ